MLTIEKRIVKSVRRLYLKDFEYERTEGDTLESFIENLINEYNNVYDTHYVCNDEVQTEASKNRSLGDLYLLCRYHFDKDVTVKQIKEILVKLYRESRIGTLYCTTIRKRTYKPPPDNEYSRYMSESYHPDEFGKKFEEVDY